MKQNFHFTFILSLIATLSIGSVGKCQTTQTVSGYVYHDANSNQQKEDVEKGIPKVALSNGNDVVTTNQQGYYSLPVDSDAIIFVIKPNNWMTPLNDLNLPLFYYIHKPQGSPADFDYTGVAPTGELPREINFPLYPADTTEHFKMVVFGDPQPYTIEQVDFVAEDIVRELIGRNDLEFGMTMGDIVGDDLDLFTPLNQAVSKIGIPWYNVIGNHDINFDATIDQRSDETFENTYGPATYAFVYGNAHFIVVDDVIYPKDGRQYEYVGGLRPDQLNFVENYLNTVSREDLVVITMHIPLAQHGETFRKSDQKKLFDLLKDFPHSLSISAHTHEHHHRFFHQDSSDWQRPQPHHHFNVGTTSGSWWNGMRGENNIPHAMMRDGTPNGYSIITFKGTDYLIDWKAAGRSEDYRMNIHVPRGIITGTNDTVMLTVNFFNGSEQATVEYRISGQTDWRVMERVNDYDPYYLILDENWKNFEKAGLINACDTCAFDSTFMGNVISGNPLPDPKPSSHIWKSTLNTNLPVGRHVIEVRVNDQFGRTFKDYQMLRIAAPINKD
ncbi:MAG: metallophosphoesterase [Bacteroidetes bacterium]|jgi:hypothetical protein|nr:metallophosphoesterase [Bacteroidota bacterium]